MMKKGFTLIELLAVITIMGIILLISVPNITKSMKKTTSNQYAEFVGDIFLAAESYIAKYNDSFDLSSGDKTISVERLIKAGYFKSTTINPKTGEKVNVDSYVIVSLNSQDSYSYTYVDENQAVCSSKEQVEGGNDIYYCDPGDGELRKFYLIEQLDDEMVLILDRNIGSFTQYDDTLSYLEENTKNWYDVEVSMPTVSQLLSSIGYSSDISSGNIEISSNFLNINTDCDINICTEKVDSKKSSGTVLGYWVNNPESSWVVSGNSLKQVSKTDTGYGVRPIITIKNRIELSE